MTERHPRRPDDVYMGRGPSWVPRREHDHSQAHDRRSNYSPEGVGPLDEKTKRLMLAIYLYDLSSNVLSRAARGEHDRSDPPVLRESFERNPQLFISTPSTTVALHENLHCWVGPED